MATRRNSLRKQTPVSLQGLDYLRGKRTRDRREAVLGTSMRSHTTVAGHYVLAGADSPEGVAD
jgi:hypothetical protein